MSLVKLLVIIVIIAAIYYYYHKSNFEAQDAESIANMFTSTTTYTEFKHRFPQYNVLTFYEIKELLNSDQLTKENIKKVISGFVI